MNVRIFRWKAIVPLTLFLALVALLVVLFAEPVAKETTEEASTELLGTQVDVEKLDIYARDAAVELRGLQIADPFAPMKNLIEARDIRLKLDPVALAEKKIVVQAFTLSGMRFGTERRTPAKPVEGGGFAPQMLGAVRTWAKQFDVPLLQLTPIDTIRQIALDPTKLTTVRQAQALVTRTDSTRKAIDESIRTLAIRPTVDSAAALAQRLAATNPRELGLDGTRQAIEAVRRTLADLDAAKKRVENLERSADAGISLLGQGVEGLNDATRQDYAFARGLLKLPSFSAPEIGKAFFGDVSIERFQQALYWAELAQKYMPPGLLPREEPGPKRLRADGTTVQFPKEHEYPSFLVESGKIDFAVEGSPARGAYEATVRGLTSAPALYGKPMVVTARRTAEGSAIASIDVNASIDHVSQRIRDSVTARLRGVSLPSFDLPNTPFGVVPGKGASTLAFSLRGDQIRGRWAIASDQVSWRADTTGRKLNDVERLVWRVISGLRDLNVAAEVSGPIRAPKLSVASNLDQAVASRIEAVIGEEVARAERIARAKVDSIVRERVEPVKRQVAQVRTEATQRIEAEKKRLDEVEAQLNGELKRLTGGLAPDIKLPVPKIKL